MDSRSTHLTDSTIVRVARWNATHPWRAIVIWLAFVVACIAVGAVAGLDSVTALDTTSGQSGQAAHWLHRADLTDPATENVLITARLGRLDVGTATDAAADVRRRLSQLPQVASVAPLQRSPDGQALLVEAMMKGDPYTADDRVSGLLNATSATSSDYPNLRIEQVGAASLAKATNDEIASGLGTVAELSLPTTVLILLVVFGAFAAAGVPVLLALSAVGSAIGLSAVASHLIPDSGTTSSMILLMGMAVGVDYSLFYIKRVREERARGRGQLDAIEVAAATSGHSVMVSGLAVSLAMAGLFAAQDVVFSSLAAGSILVVAVAVVSSITVLPAVLGKLGGRLDRPRAPLAWRLSSPTREPRVWSRLLNTTSARPAATLVASVGVLIALAAPMLSLRLHSDSEASLPRSMPAVQSFARLAADFPGQQTSHEIAVLAPPTDAARVTNQLAALRRLVAHDPRFPDAGGSMRVSADRTVHELDLKVPYDAESGASKREVKALRTQYVPQTVGQISGAKWAVGGDTAADVDYDHHLSSHMPWVIGSVLLLTMLMMVAVFGSVVLALVTAVMNLLSAAAAFGVLTLIFQHSWAQGVVGFQTTGAVISWIPLFMFAVLFGLSMDYHVFVVARIREAAASGMSTRDAVRIGMLRSAGAVTGAAIVMLSVFAIFATQQLVDMKEIGIGLAVAVLLDAFVIRAIVLPSLLIVLGARIWWPSRLSRTPQRPIRLAAADEPASVG